MATSNVKKKMQALAELRKDPAAALVNAWASVGAFAEDATLPKPSPWDLDLIEQVVLAVVEDAKADAKKAGDA